MQSLRKFESQESQGSQSQRSNSHLELQCHAPLTKSNEKEEPKNSQRSEASLKEESKHSDKASNSKSQH